MSELYINGFHGTSISSARCIAKNGFSTLNGDIFFAPLDNLFLALDHGRRRAAQNNESQFGVIQGLFPGRKLEFGFDGDHIRILREEIDKIQIVRFMAYTSMGQLVESIDPREQH